MTDLLEAYQSKQAHLKGEAQKLFSKFISKVQNSSYAVDEKNIEKLREFADNKSVVELIVDTLQQYQKRSGIRELPEHYDVLRLRPSWAILALSNEAAAKEYLLSLTEWYIQQEKPMELHFLYWLLGLFPDDEFALLTTSKITAYYNNISSSLQAYQWGKKAGIALPEISPKGWYIHFTLQTSNDWYSSGLTNDEKERMLSLDVYISSPNRYNRTYEITLSNKAGSLKGYFTDSPNGTTGVKEKSQTIPLAVDLLSLKDFILKVEELWNVHFILDKAAYLGVSKGVDKKAVKNWIEQKNSE